MTDGPGVPGRFTETDIRDVVRRIVDGLVVADAAPEVPAPTQREPTPPTETPGTSSVAIGADHGGFALKERLGFRLREAGWTVHDCGTDSTESVDYPEYAHAVARLVADGTCRDGIIVDGAGIGSAMVANKVPGVRAALCYDLSSARNSREHNHANVLTLGAGLIGEALAWQIVETWLSTQWGPDRHARRVAMISEVERTYLRSALGPVGASGH